jgi:hypothetical protein
MRSSPVSSPRGLLRTLVVPLRKITFLRGVRRPSILAREFSRAYISELDHSPARSVSADSGRAAVWSARLSLLSKLALSGSP